jgi:autoinducer 2-degrading protein
MIAKWVRVKVKPEGRRRFLEAIEIDALGSEEKEPGCLRFNVLQDTKDEDVYYFYEVYEDPRRVVEHEQTGHFKAWLAVKADALQGDVEVVDCRPVFPSERRYWGKT